MSKMMEKRACQFKMIKQSDLEQVSTDIGTVMDLLFKTNFKVTKNPLKVEISNLCKSEAVCLY